MMKYSLALALIVNCLTRIYSQELSNDEVKSFTSKMFVSDKYEVEVLKISEAKNNIRIVAITIPYREFPSILIFTYNNASRKWNRVFEGLMPGIQDAPSGLLDLHTTGVGIDFNTNRDTLYQFDSERVKKMIAASKQANSILIPYQTFLHFHTADSTSKRLIQSYTIDKTKYRDFAIEIFGKNHWSYSKGECMMYDSQRIVDFDFNYTNRTYQIIVKTESSQVWTYSFKGVDQNNEYLVDKKIEIRK